MDFNLYIKRKAIASCETTPELAGPVFVSEEILANARETLGRIEYELALTLSRISNLVRDPSYVLRDAKPDEAKTYGSSIELHAGADGFVSVMAQTAVGSEPEKLDGYSSLFALDQLDFGNRATRDRIMDELGDGKKVSVLLRRGDAGRISLHPRGELTGHRCLTFLASLGSAG